MEITQIHIDELEAQVDQLPLIDVREVDEYQAGHVPGALSFPMSGIADQLGELPEGPLNVICQAGGRSQKVCEFLVQQGRSVSNVAGGTGAWANSGRAVVTGDDPR
jgi:rhodanese-related sulfurtransferase